MTGKIVVALLCVPTFASAHPGHGHTPPGTWLHYLSEPAHIGALAGAGALAMSVAAWRRMRQRRRS